MLPALDHAPSFFTFTQGLVIYSLDLLLLVAVLVWWAQRRCVLLVAAILRAGCE
jgi:hypothetical protein